MLSTRHRDSVSVPAELAFSLIEIIVAMAILSIVVSGFALAVTGSENAGQQERVAANKAAIAKKAHEQLQGNVDAQSACGKVWAVAEKAAVNSTAKVNYQPCRWPAAGTTKLVDEENRTYDVVATLLPVDDASDGTGLAKSLDTNGAGGDADFNTRDRVDVSIDVKLAPNSIAGLSPASAADTYTMRGRAAWATTESGGTARVMVCVLDRPDRAMAAGRCVASASGEDQPSQPLGGVQVRLTPLGGGTSYTATSTGGIASFNGILPDGTYQVSASNLQGFTMFKASPKAISISGSDPQEATIYLARTGSQVEVCGRITNADNWGFGWKVTQATLNWGALGAPLRRGMRMDGLSDKWRCVASGIVDPLGYSSTKLYRGRYVVEVSRVTAGGNPFRVNSIAACPSGNQASWSLFSGAGINDPGTLVSPSTRTGLNFDERAGKKARICIEFYSAPIAAINCTAGSPGCKLVDTQCSPASCLPTVDCWNCGTIPVPADSAFGSVGPAGVHNGPNESNVSCRNSRTATSWSTPYYSGSRSARSTWQSRAFLGVYNSSMSMSSQGKHPDGRWNECPEIAFTMTRSITNTCGSFSLGHPCGGSKPYSLGECIEAKINGRVVRGLLYDTFVAGQPSLGVEIGAWDRFIDDPAINIDWYAYGIASNVPHSYGTTSGASPSWMNGMPRIKWRKITNDPVCQSSSAAVDEEDKIQDVMPATIVKIYKKQGPDDVADPIWPIPGLAQLGPVTSTKSL
jgi:prepilin-type N-terminal cleavage/methylation domain-containing protein